MFNSIPTDEGIVDIRARSVALAGEPQVLLRDAVTGAATGVCALGGNRSLHDKTKAAMHMATAFRSAVWLLSGGPLLQSCRAGSSA